MMLKPLTSVLVAAAILGAGLPADAALNAYLTLKGQKSGVIKGSVTQKGREDSIMVIAYEHEVKTPVEARSGQPTGKRQHGVFKITKEIDRSSPLLYSALINNETLSEFTLRFWTPQIKAATGVGSEFQHYTVKLTNARIVGIRSYMLNNKNPELSRYAETEEISFAYQKIEWTWNDGGITAADDWASP
jgi:type VI secretion system secreted protein Hcp